MKKLCLIIVALYSSNVFASEIYYSLWNWTEYLHHSPGKLQENGIGINVEDSHSINSFIDYKNTFKYQIGYYQGFLIPKVGQNNIENFNTHVERLSWNGSLEYKLHPNLSLLTELDTDIRSIDTFGKHWTPEAYFSFQPGVRIKPLGNNSLSMDIIQPIIKEYTNYGIFSPKSKHPLIRLSGRFDFDDSSSLSLSADYLKTKDSEFQFYSKENRYYYQPAFQKLSLNLNFQKKF